MKRHVIWWVMIMTVYLFFSSMGAAQEKPDATLTLEQGEGRVGMMTSFGEGLLTYQGKDYPFKVDGLYIVDLGVTNATAKGSVYGLGKLEDFNGNYIAATEKGTLGIIAGATTMKNRNGVLIDVVTTTQGLRMEVAPSGVWLNLK